MRKLGVLNLEGRVFMKTLDDPFRRADEELQGLLAQTKSQWMVNEGKIGSSLNINRQQVEEAIKNRGEPLQVDQLINTIRDLCHPRADDPNALAEVMEKVPGYENAVRVLVGFMTGETEANGAHMQMSEVEALETLGLERARNLAITFFALNYEKPTSHTFDWTPLWRHQISVGVVMDFLFDALDLRRSGYEYALGAFHDIGKLILAELFPFAYFSAMNRSMLEWLPLVNCEMEMFGGLTHAEMGADWLRLNDFPSALVEAVAQHEMPAQVSRRAILTHALISTNQLVKQIGIGYSGNSMLDPLRWDELPSTVIIWEARGNKDYPYEDFTRDILGQFHSFPDLM